MSTETQTQIFNALSDAIACANREPGLLARIAELEMEVKLYESELELARKRIADREAQINDLHTSRNELRIDLERLQCDHEALNKALDEDESTIVSHLAKIDEQREEIKYQGRLITELQHEKGELIAKLAASKGLGTQLQTTLNRILGEAKDAIATLPASEVAAVATFLGSEPVEGDEAICNSFVSSPEPVVECTDVVAEEVTPSFAHVYVNMAEPETKVTSRPWNSPACEWDSSTI